MNAREVIFDTENPWQEKMASIFLLLALDRKTSCLSISGSFFFSGMGDKYVRRGLDVPACFRPSQPKQPVKRWRLLRLLALLGFHSLSCALLFGVRMRYGRGPLRALLLDISET